MLHLLCPGRLKELLLPRDFIRDVFFKSLFKVRWFCLSPCKRTVPDSIYLFPEGLGQYAYCIDYTGRTWSQLGWNKANEITPDLNQHNEAQNTAHSFVVSELVFFAQRDTFWETWRFFSVVITICAFHTCSTLWLRYCCCAVHIDTVTNHRKENLSQKSGDGLSFHSSHWF